MGEWGKTSEIQFILLLTSLPSLTFVNVRWGGFPVIYQLSLIKKIRIGRVQAGNGDWGRSAKFSLFSLSPPHPLSHSSPSGDMKRLSAASLLALILRARGGHRGRFSEARERKSVPETARFTSGRPSVDRVTAVTADEPGM